MHTGWTFRNRAEYSVTNWAPGSSSAGSLVAEVETMLEAPTCYLRNCRHFRGVKEEASPEREVSDGVVEVSTGGETVFCLAYPDGIPDRFAYEPDFDKVDLHMLVQEDQVGDLVFEEGDWMEDEKND